MVCQEVDGFIYVANAEPEKGERKWQGMFFFSPALFEIVTMIFVMMLVLELSVIIISKNKKTFDFQGTEPLRCPRLGLC